MIKELAFTPHIFDEQSNPTASDWSYQLNLLGERIKPWDGTACPFVISGLCDGGWKEQAKHYVLSIEAPFRDKAQALFTGIESRIVNRMSFGDWPGDDEQLWIQEAVNVSRQGVCPISRIVASSSQIKPGKGVHVLSDMNGSGFWRGLGSDDSPPMVLAEQVKRLQLLCLHANYISFSSAYMRGGDDCETAFAEKLLDTMTMLQTGRRIVLDLHCEAGGLVDEMSPQVVNMVSRFKEYTSSNVLVQLYFWPKIRERILLAGEIVSVSGQDKCKVRWGVAMNHVARAKGQNPNDFTHWKLLKKWDIMQWNERFYHKSPVYGPLQV